MSLVIMLIGSIVFVLAEWEGPLDYYGKISTGYSVFIFGLVLQLLGRVYFMTLGYRVKRISQGWIPRPVNLKWDLATLLNVVNLCGLSLTVISYIFVGESIADFAAVQGGLPSHFVQHPSETTRMDVLRF
jgi:hypothetical protein